MIKQEIINIVKKIGISKGYRMDYPEDWYGGIYKKELRGKIKYLDKSIKDFKHINNIIKECFPEYEFLDWKFNRTTHGFWNDVENKIKYLKWIEKENNWNKPEDWYNINRSMFKEHLNFLEILNLLYPNFKFDAFKFKSVPMCYWNDFENLKKFLLPLCQEFGRMPTKNEIFKYKNINKVILKYGGINEISKTLGFETSTMLKSLSGNILKSTYEVIVDNFLYLNNIRFKYEGKIIDNSPYKYDFKINDVFIEVWGYGGNAYNIKRKKKENIYKENNLKLISLEFDLFRKNDLEKINNELIFFLMKHNIKNKNFYNEDLSNLNSFISFNKNKVIEELKQECIKQKLKKIPTVNWWNNNGFKKHIKFISSNARINYSDLANILELELNEKPKNYWKNFDNLKKELLPICDELKCFPTQTKLNELKRTDITNAIAKYHGGFVFVKEKMIIN